MARKKQQQILRNGDPVAMVLRCHKLACEYGRRYARSAFEELVNYLGHRLGINPDRCKLSEATVQALDKEFDMEQFTGILGDHLGEAFSRLELGNSALSQCLTPMHIADFMVAMNGCAHMKSGETILDPCSGTGVFLVAALKAIPPTVQLYGIELDLTLYRATLVQLTGFTSYGKKDNPFFLLNANTLMDELDWSQANRWEGRQGQPLTPVITPPIAQEGL